MNATGCSRIMHYQQKPRHKDAFELFLDHHRANPGTTPFLSEEELDAKFTEFMKGKPVDEL